MKKYLFIRLMFLLLIALLGIKSINASSIETNDSTLNHINKWRQKDSLAPWLLAYVKISYQHKVNGDFEKSFSVIDSILNQLWRPPKTKKELSLLATLKVSRAYLYEREGSFFNAQKDYFDAAQIYIELERKGYNIARYVWHPLGNIYTRLGENELASHFIEKSLNTYQELGEIEDLIQAHSDLAIVLINQKKYKEAILKIDEGIKIKQEIPLNRALLYNSKAIALLALKRYEKGLITVDSSLLFLSKAKKKYKAQVDYKDLISGYFVGTYSLKASLYSKLGSFNRAENEYNKALALGSFFKGGKHRKLARVYLGIAEINQENNDPAEALRAYQNALIACIPKFNDTAIIVNPKSKDFYAEIVIGEALLGKAKAAGEYYKNKKDIRWLQLAKECYNLYFNWEKNIRSEYFFESSKLQFTEELHKATEDALELLSTFNTQTHGENVAEQAFHWIEQSKGVLLSEAITEMKHQLPNLTKDSSFHQLQLQKKRYRLSLKNQWGTERNESKQNLVNQNIQELREKIFQLENQLKNKFPYLKEIKTNANNLININSLNNYLEEQEADLITYYLGKNKAFLVFLSNKQFYFYSIDRSDINKKCTDFQNSLANLGEKADRYHQLAYTLYQQLIPFDSIAKNKKWIILPDGELNKIPFEALVNKEQKKPTSFKALNYLLLQHQIIYAPSAKMLLRSNKQTDYKNVYLGISPDFTNSSFATLQHALNEVKTAKTSFGGNIVSGSSIDKKVLLNELPNYQIIHWVSHAGVDSKNRTWIALNPNNNDQSKLFPPELLPLQLSTHLLNLNACETAAGEYKAGEGIYSLSRSFIFSGVRNVLTNLWQANHQINSQIINTFYSNLKSNGDISSSLTEAKQSYIKNDQTDELGAHPYYWAAPILIGNNQELKLQKELNYYFILFSLLILLLVMFALIKYFNN